MYQLSTEEELARQRREGTQMPSGELASLLKTNQPWKDQDEIYRDVAAEQLRQRLWNGHGHRF